MECRQMNELLSLYVDDALDPGSRREVEEHLAICSHCAAERDDLVSYQKAVGSLRRVKAPADFLQNVHERLEHPSPVKRLLDLLLTPFRMGSPIKWAGVVAAMLVVFITYHGMNLYKERGYAPQVAQFSPPTESPKESSETPSESVSNEKKRTPAAIQPQRADASAKPIELALLLSPAHPRAAAEADERRGGVKLKRSRDLPAPAVENDRELEEVSPQPHAESPAPPSASARRQGPASLKSERMFPAPKAGSASRPNAEGEAIGEGKLAGSSGPARSGRGELRETSSLFDESKSIERVQDLIRSAGGTILAVESEKGDHISRSITATLPAEDFVKLLEKLRLIGQIRGYTTASLPTPDQHMVQVKIRVVFPE